MGSDRSLFVAQKLARWSCIFATLFALVGCGERRNADESQNDDEEAEQLDTVTSALSSSATFNNADEHFEQIVKIPRGKFGLYDREGNLMKVIDLAGDTVWIQGNERVESKSKGTLYWMWGHPSGSKFSGYIRGEVISGEKGVRVRGEKGASNRNGRKAPLTGQVLTVAIKELPPNFLHATTEPGDVNQMRQYAVSPISYKHAYLTWSVPWNAQAKAALSGGGITRTIVIEGAKFHVAAVNEIVMPAYSAPGVQSGTVTWAYGYVEQGGKRVFGWMIKSHQETGGQPILHLS